MGCGTRVGRRMVEGVTMSQQLYFIKAGARIKIGIAADIGRRVRQLQTGCPEPLELLGTIPGSRGVERCWHRRWAQIRTGGEWFKATPELLEEIDRTLRPRPPSAAARHGWQLVGEWARDGARW